MRSSTAILGIVGLAAVVVSGAPAWTGDLGSRNVRRSMGWESSNCFRPSEPYFYVSDADSFNLAVDEFNNYVEEMRQFITCVNDEAADDANTVVRAIEDGRDEEVSNATSEVENVKASLESQRPY